MTDDKFTGTWQFCYWYPSNDHDGDDPSEYQMRARQKGDNLILESLPNELDAYMLVRLEIDGDLATGSWHETTSPRGAFKGMMYSGAGQLLISKDKNSMTGMWAGAGIDRATNQPSMYTGKWELKKLN